MIRTFGDTFVGGVVGSGLLVLEEGVDGGGGAVVPGTLLCVPIGSPDWAFVMATALSFGKRIAFMRSPKVNDSVT
ncbi:MAG TPA: hypothetical protein PKM72_05770 [Nitrospirales bacterium]|nr:hypothetical protein [Nitrospirales bacterium]